MDASVKALLAECCKEHRAATLMSTESGLSCSARFDRQSGNTVSLALFPTASAFLRPLVFRPLSGAVLSFMVDTRTHVLIGSVLQYEQEVDPPRLSLEVRSPLVSAEARSSFRIPIFPNSGLQVRITREEITWQTQPINISAGGILVELRGTNSTDLEVDAEVSMELQLGNRKANVTAVVRRREGERCALMFAMKMKEGDIEPPSAVSEIARELERRWLNQRMSARN